ncbi:antitoxin [Vibrio sp. MACH09]|uniref:type II toxin-antitoxin system Phd/YefM family antitoxin n=1 Tax=Vibrio sp. MACH09 TaxID=3025122 RepID=UPI00278DC1E5|nr:antitoxin of toxin-antitoxin stability system [Vibrio sp. MACH09]GLO64204.1 antitoxin [Vibrio sp. MACH09]
MSMTNTILTDISAGITQLKADPMGVIEEANGAPVAILNRNKPAFYAIPCDLFESMVEELENNQLMIMAEDAINRDDFIEVDINDL